MSAPERRHFFVRYAYFFGGLGTSMVADLAFGVPAWQALPIALPIFVAGQVVHPASAGVSQ